MVSLDSLFTSKATPCDGIVHITASWVLSPQKTASWPGAAGNAELDHVILHARRLAVAEQAPISWSPSSVSENGAMGSLLSDQSRNASGAPVVVHWKARMPSLGPA